MGRGEREGREEGKMRAGDSEREVGWLLVKYFPV